MFAATSRAPSSSPDRLPPRSVSSSALSSLLTPTTTVEDSNAAATTSPPVAAAPNPPLRSSLFSILTRRQNNYGTTTASSASTSSINTLYTASPPSSPSPSTTSIPFRKAVSTASNSHSSSASSSSSSSSSSTSPSSSPSAEERIRTGSSAPESHRAKDASSPDWTKTHRRRRSESLNLGGAFRAVREGAIFERFVLIGLSPQSEPLHGNNDNDNNDNNKDTSTIEDEDTEKSKATLSPSVLFYYPSAFNESLSKLLNSQIAQFCFPEGITPLCTMHSDSSQGAMSPPIRKALFTPLSDLEKSDNSFVFLLNTGEYVLYGMCVIHNEVVKNPPSFMPKKGNNGMKDDDCNFIAPRCYCIISRFPYFSTHFSVLYSVLARERLYSLTSSRDAESAENEVIRILDEYYAKDVSNFTKSLNIKLCQGLNSLDYYFPTAVEDALIADWCFPCLFRAISLTNIMSLFQHALLESKIVVVCQNLGVLSAIVMSIMPLLRPFVWQGPFIPILPSHLKECLQAPVPTIVGLRSVPEDYETNTFILDVDKDLVTLPTDNAHPSLPDYQFIYEILNQYSELLYSPENRYHDPYKTPQETKRIARQITEQFSVYNSRLLDRISSHLSEATDLTEAKQLKELVNKFHPDERDFMWSLLNTQQFSIHSERLLESAIQRKKAKEVILSKLNDLVTQEQQTIEAAQEMIRLQQLRIAQAQESIAALKTTQSKLSISGFTPSIIECHPFSSTAANVLNKSG
eukprot:TRINITY_DN3193_c0_g1_i1.p1 TRINITY_DN3193_c0_g1~~TRINITY_DN3193_c0_g1_i1.p1  ORF type:complete len:745 (-),score=145.87 TRINITY_DN3193_c0_g1_i1:41-2275(-)